MAETAAPEQSKRAVSFGRFPDDLTPDFYSALTMLAQRAILKRGVAGYTQADDLAHEVFVELLKMHREDKLRTNDAHDLMGLASTIMVRRAIDLYRKSDNRRVFPARDPGGELIGTAAALDYEENQDATRTSTRINRLDAVDQMAEVLDYVCELSTGNEQIDRDYEVLVLHEIYGLTYAEIKEQLSTSRSARGLRDRVYKLRKRLKKRFPSLKLRWAG